jgi:LemA protein
MLAWLVLLGLVGLALFYGVALYNKLVRLRNGSENAWSDIDVQLKRRRDLVPNLVAAVKGYATHERETLDAVIEARSRAGGGGTPGQVAESEGVLTQALGRLIALAEAYPELKANENFLSLQEQLSEIETAIQNARRYYNAVIRDLNNACEAFPSVIVANAFGFSKGEYFELDSPEERTAPQVDFGA